MIFVRKLPCEQKQTSPPARPPARPLRRRALGTRRECSMRACVCVRCRCVACKRRELSHLSLSLGGGRSALEEPLPACLAPAHCRRLRNESSWWRQRDWLVSGIPCSCARVDRATKSVAAHCVFAKRPTQLQAPWIKRIPRGRATGSSVRSCIFRLQCVSQLVWLLGAAECRRPCRLSRANQQCAPQIGHVLRLGPLLGLLGSLPRGLESGWVVSARRTRASLCARAA